MYCPNCGKEIGNSNSCPKCGWKDRTPAKPKKKPGCLIGLLVFQKGLKVLHITLLKMHYLHQHRYIIVQSTNLQLKIMACLVQTSRLSIHSISKFLLNEMSQTFHKLYAKRLVRGYWRDRSRPILNNNWEATYFDFTEER